MKDVELIPLGAEVLIGPRDDAEPIIGTINTISLTADGHGGVRALYEVAWWSGRDHKECWLHRHEFRATTSDKRLRIGFGATAEVN